VLAELLKYIYPSSDQSVLCDCGGGGDDDDDDDDDVLFLSQTDYDLRH